METPTTSFACSLGLGLQDLAAEGDKVGGWALSIQEDAAFLGDPAGL